MADDADMRNELSDMQQRADQLADEVSFTKNSGSESSREHNLELNTERSFSNWKTNFLVSKFK